MSDQTINLPLSLYTEWYWQIDLHNLLRFLALRLDPHAQLEIRKYAEVIRDIGKKVCPIAFEAFEDHLVNGIRLSGKEAAAVRNLLKGQPEGLEGKELERFRGKLGLE